MHHRKHGFLRDLNEVMFGILAFQQACINRKRGAPDPKFSSFLYSSFLKGDDRADLDEEQSEDEMKAILGVISKSKTRPVARKVKKVVSRRGSKI